MQIRLLYLVFLQFVDWNQMLGVLPTPNPPPPQAKKITSPPIVYECVRVNGCAACDVVSRTLLQHIPH